jgi:hypothetical protein
MARASQAPARIAGSPAVGHVAVQGEQIAQWSASGSKRAPEKGACWR